jgi:alcohol dehydrogenase
VLATVTNAAAPQPVDRRGHRRGELIIVGVAMEPMDITPLQLVSGAKRVYGHASGIAVDTQNTMKFAAQSGVRTWIEEAPLEEADAAFQKMLSGQARFRVVLTTGN